jgi:hypothetical protein
MNLASKFDNTRRSGKANPLNQSRFTFRFYFVMFAFIRLVSCLVTFTYNCVLFNISTVYICSFMDIRVELYPFMSHIERKSLIFILVSEIHFFLIIAEWSYYF